MTTTEPAIVPNASDETLAASHRFCHRLTREAAKNFYYGLRLLPEPRRSAMFALYAYMRLVDDIADREDGRSVAQRRDDLERWRERTHAVLEGRSDGTEEGGASIWPAFADLVARYRVPAECFDAAIAGQQQDLEPLSFETFAQLREYCYRVAGVVGIASLHIWGFTGGAESEQMAVSLGLAFQLTNIVRDLREDAARGRSYLPAEDLHAVGVDAKELRSGVGGAAFGRLIRLEVDRAESYYDRARGLEQRITPSCRPTLIAMTEIYRRLLAKVSRSPEAVLHKRVRLSPWSKLTIGWRAAWASRGAADR